MAANKFCPNLQHPDAQSIINKVGLIGFYKEYIKNNYTIPTVYGNVDEVPTTIQDRLAVNRELFDANQQSSIVDSFIYQIYNLRKTKPDYSVGQIKTELRDNLTKDAEEFIATGDPDWIELGNNTNNVLQHFDRFWELAEEKLASFGVTKTVTGIQEDNNTPAEDSAYEDTNGIYQKTNYSDESNFAQSSKDTASAHMKTVLSLVPRYEYEDGKVVIDEDGNPVEDLNLIGLPTYEDLDSIWNDLLYTLVDVERGKKLEYLKDSNNPKHRVIYDLITSDPSINIQNEFEVVFSKQQAKFITALIRRPDNGGNKSISIIDTNRNDPENMMIADWYNDFLSSKLIKTDINGNMSVDTENGKKLQELYNKAVNDWDVPMISKIFKNIGITLSEKALESDGIYVDRKLTSPKDILTENGKFIFNRLAGDLETTDTEDVDSDNSLEANNPFLQENRPLELIARLENKVNPGNFEASFISGDNKAKYSFVNNTYATHQFNKLTSDTAYLNKLKSSSYASESIWLNQLLTNPTFKHWFEFRYVDTLGNDANNQVNKPFGQMNTKEKELFRVFSFQNSGQTTDKNNTNYVGYFVGLTPSDKTTLPVFRSLVQETSVNENFVFSQDTIEVLRDQFLSEYKRVKTTIEQNEDPNIIPIDKYHGKQGMGSKFIMFPMFNKLLFQDGVLMELDDTRISNIVNPALQEFAKDLTQDQINYWTSLGIYNKDIFDKSYKRKRGVTDQNINDGLRSLAANYSINYFVALMNQTQLFSGDPALHGKPTKIDGGLIDIGSSIDKTWINYFKRMAKDIAPGLDPNFEQGETFNTIFLKDLEYKSKHLSEYRAVIGDKVDQSGSYGNINPADAQEYTTLDEHVRVMKALGRLPEGYLEAVERLKKGGSDINDIQLVAQPMKPVYVEGVVEDSINKMYYIKTSSFPLIPALTRGLEIDKLRVLMEDPENNIQRAVYESGVKLGIQGNILDVSNDGGDTFNELSINPKQIINLPRTGFRIQQEIPFHGDDTTINEGSQGRKLITNNLLDSDIVEYNGKQITGREAKEIYESLHIEKMNRAFDQFKKDIGVDEFGRISNLEALAKILKDEATARNYPLNDIYSIEVIEENGVQKFKVPLAFTQNAQRFESILNSIVTNRVIKSELPGFAKVQGSGVGFTRVVGSERLPEFESEILWVNPEDTELNYIRSNEDGTRLLSADILVPNYLRGNNGDLVNISDYIKEDGSLDTNRIPEDVLTVIGLRIPTQGYNSMMKFRVKGFLPRYMGDLAIVPSEITSQMGSDFDVDKMFIYNYHHKVDSKGNIRKITAELPDTTEIEYSKLSKQQLDNLIIQMFEDRLSDVNIYAEILEPNGFGKLPDVAKKVSKLGAKRDSKYTLTSQTQNNIYDINKSGKLGTAKFSLASTFFKAAQDAKLSINEPLRFKKDSGEIVSLNNLFEVNNIEGNKRSNVILYLQSAAVDNSKEQILGNLNINDHTMGVASTMAMLGLPEDFIGLFMAQPSIKEYVATLSNATDIVDGGGQFDPMLSSTTIEDISNRLSNGQTIEVQPLSTSELESELSGEGNNIIQTNVINMFAKLKDISDEIQTIQSAINPDTKGIGSSFAALEAKYIQIANTSEAIIKQKDSLLDNEGKKNLLWGNTTIANSIDVLNKSRGIFSSINLYTGPVYGEIINPLLESADLSPSETNIKDIYNNLKSYILSSGDFINSEDINLIRDSLLYGKENIAERWQQYSKTPEGRRNILTKRIKAKIARNNEDYNGLTANNTPASSNATDINNATMYFYDMINSSNQTEKKLAEDMVRYFILTGAQFGPTSIGKYITYDILEKYGFSKKLRALETNIQNGETDSLKSFRDQYFQNNPFKAKTIDLTKTPEEIALNLNTDNIFTKSGDVAKYLVAYDKSTRKPVLYKYVGIGESDSIVYKQIPVLGTKQLKKYDFNAEPLVIESALVKKKDEQVPVTDDIPTTTIDNKSDLIRNKYSFNDGIESILNNIVESSQVPEYKQLASELLNNNLDITLRESTNNSSNGAYIPSQNTIEINLDKISTFTNYYDKFEQVFLEELVHGLTVKNLTNESNEGLTPKQITAKNKINRLYKEYIDNFANKDDLERFKSIMNTPGSERTQEDIAFARAHLNDLYPLINVAEFVGQGLTKPEFREVLKSNNFWTRLLDLIKNVLGINVESDLDFLYSNTLDLIQGEQTESDTDTSFNIDEPNEFNRDEYNRLMFVDQRDKFLANWNVKDYFNNQHKKYTAKSQAKFLTANGREGYDRLKIWFWNNELRVSRKDPVITPNEAYFNMDDEDTTPKSREDKYIDRILAKYDNTVKDLQNRLKVTSNDAEKAKLQVLIDNTNNRLDDLKNDRSVIKIVDSVERRLRRIEKLLDADNPDYHELSESFDYIKEFILINQEIDFDTGSDIGAKYAAKADKIAGHAAKMLSRIKDKSANIVQEWANTSVDWSIAPRITEMLSQGISDVNSREAGNLDFSQSSSEHIQALGYLQEAAQSKANDEHNEFMEQLLPVESEYHSKYGDDYSQLYQLDEKGKPTKFLLNKYKDDFWKKSKGNFKFWINNTVVNKTEEGTREFEEAKKLVKETASEEDYLNWLRDNDPDLYIEDFKKGKKFNWNRGAKKYLDIRPSDDWVDPRYAQLMNKGEDDPAVKFYKIVEPLFRRLNRKYTDGQINYVPELQKSTAKYFLEGNLKGGISNLWESFTKDLDNDVYISGNNSNLDPLTGEPRLRIPVRFFGNNIEETDRSTDLARIAEVVMYQEVSNKAKHEIEPLLKMYYSLLKDAKQNKGFDENGDAILIDKSADKLTEQASFMINGWLYGLYRDPNPEEQKYGKYVDSVINYVRLKGMAYNPFSAIGNIGQGIMSNFTFGAGSQYFGQKDYFKATGTMLHSIAGKTATAKKISKAFQFTDAFVRHNEMNFGTSRELKTARNKFSFMGDAFFMQQMGEYFVQGQTMVAVLNKEKVQDLEGNSRPLWEAFDDNFKWKTDEFGENPYDEQKTRDKLRAKIRKAIIDVHGNYTRPIQNKKHYYYRLLYTFRTWLPQAVTNRFGAEQTDILFGTTTKGRYRSVPTMWKDGSGKLDWSALKDNVLWLVKLGSKTTLSDVDKTNMRKNLSELIMLSIITATLLALRAGFDDWDDEKKELFTYAYNNLTRAQSDLLFFMNPAAMDAIIKDPVPAMSVINDFIDVNDAAISTLMGEGVYKSGHRKGQLKLIKETVDNIPLINQVPKNIGYMENIFERR